MHLQGAPPWRVLARIVYASSHATRTLFHPHQPLFLRVTIPSLPVSRLAPLSSRFLSSHSMSLFRSLHVRVVPFSFSRPSRLPPPFSLSLSLSLCVSPLASRRSSISPLSRPSQRQPRSGTELGLPFYSPPFTCVFHLAPTSHPSGSLSLTLCSSPALDSLSS